MSSLLLLLLSFSQYTLGFRTGLHAFGIESAIPRKIYFLCNMFYLFSVQLTTPDDY
jgi:hypothetical protein